ncbi:hypothetical protein HXV88_08535 [Aeromonas veronii]|uniref:hypothetical protein n=1 Tax=Aeromonas veronii TaxID=654 RepID=UPI0015CFA4CB|nr:hypothetical protein [Aeromonas veronii]QLH66498.1 hypothetical protein HXV88_08535 [Aeromonas veronii]
MKPYYQSAVVAIDGKTKIYQTSRVIEIFKLAIEPKHNAFYGSIIESGDTCTEEQIDIATAAHEATEQRNEKQEQIKRKQQEEKDLIQSYKESLIDVRDCLVNSNNGKVFLLPENHGLMGMYQSFLDIEILPEADFDFIEKHSTSLVDTFVLEPVSQLTASRIMELEDERE